MRDFVATLVWPVMAIMIWIAVYWGVDAVVDRVQARKNAALRRERNEVCVKICEDLNATQGKGTQL